MSCRPERWSATIRPRSSVFPQPAAATANERGDASIASTAGLVMHVAPQTPNHLVRRGLVDVCPVLRDEVAKERPLGTGLEPGLLLLFRDITERGPKLGLAYLIYPR